MKISLQSRGAKPRISKNYCAVCGIELDDASARKYCPPHAAKLQKKRVTRYRYRQSTVPSVIIAEIKKEEGIE